jgi:hypothetical protein
MRATPGVKKVNPFDLVLLKSCIDAGAITRKERDECLDILVRLNKKGGSLSKAQRTAVQKIADRRGIEVGDAGLMSSGLIARGKEVETPWLLRHENLPMKPPGKS